MKRDKWLKYRRSAIYDSRLFPIFEGIKEYFSQYFAMPFGSLVDYCDGTTLEWYWERNWLLRFGDRMIDDFIENNREIQLWREKWQIEFETIRDGSDNIIFQSDLTELTDSELRQLFTDWNETSKLFHCLCEASIDALDESLSRELRARLKILTKNASDFENLFKVFSTPSAPSYIQRRDKEIMELAKQQDRKKDTDEIVRKYWWTSLGWTPNDRFGEKDVENSIVDLLKQNIEESLKEIDDVALHIATEKKKCLEELGNDKDLIGLLQVFEEVTLLHDQRKEAQVRLIEIHDAIALEISRRRTGLGFSDLLLLNFNELCQYFDGSGLKSLLIERKKHYFRYLSGDKIVALDGDEAIRMRDEMIGRGQKKKVSEFRGISASRGLVKGRVRVSNDAKYLIKNLVIGEILVTGQTMPDFVPAMRRAAAIITDEGGATCHAAIISRELGIPCVVGTKIATDVLENGDLVEVDANTGIIKLIKRKKSKLAYGKIARLELQ